MCDDWCATSCDAECIANVADFFPSQTLLVFCFSFAKPSDFWFGPSQKGTICSSAFNMEEERTLLARGEETTTPQVVKASNSPCPRSTCI